MKKIIVKLLVFNIIEFGTFIYFKVDNLEAFFMLWGFFGFFILLYNVVPNGRNSRPVVGVSRSNDISKNVGFGGLADNVNLLFIVFVIENVVGYISTMPK